MPAPVIHYERHGLTLCGLRLTEEDSKFGGPFTVSKANTASVTCPGCKEVLEKEQ